MAVAAYVVTPGLVSVTAPLTGEGGLPQSTEQQSKEDAIIYNCALIIPLQVHNRRLRINACF